MRFLNSLFWQLYLSILGSLVLIVMLFFAMMEYSNHQTDVNDFHRDIQLVSQSVLSDWRETQQVNLDLMKQISDESFFHISVLDADGVSRTPSGIMNGSEPSRMSISIKACKMAFR